jgi:hypothetical protein
MLKYWKLITHPKYQEVWTHSSANEFGCLAQGVESRIEGTNTIFFVQKKDIPADQRRDVTYGKFVCEYKPNTTDQERTRFTMGGDKINYPGNCATSTGNLTLFKIMLNSVISTQGARFMTLDIKNFYLNTPMEQYKYVHIKLDGIPEETIQQYPLQDNVDSEGYIFIEVQKGMYGLPQARILAQNLLEKLLNKHTLLYYARAVDSTILTTLNAIAMQQAAPMQDTLEKIQQVLDYCASQEEAILTYHKSSMILAVHSNTSYLNKRKLQCRAGGHFYLSNNVPYPPNNGAILNIAKVIDVVFSSVAEAELWALFMNAKEAVYL